MNNSKYFSPAEFAGCSPACNIYAMRQTLPWLLLAVPVVVLDLR